MRRVVLLALSVLTLSVLMVASIAVSPALARRRPLLGSGFDFRHRLRHQFEFAHRA
jgi:hypothetical protein